MPNLLTVRTPARIHDGSRRPEGSSVPDRVSQIIASVSGTRLIHTMTFKRIVLRHL